MSNSTLLLAGAALVAAGAGAFFFLAGDSGVETIDPGADTVARDGTTGRGNESVDDAQLTALDGAAAGRAEAGRSTISEPLVEGSLRSNVDADARRIVRVEIRAPLGAPPDPELKVVAWSEEDVAPDEIDWGQASMRRRFQRRASAAEALRTFELAESDDEVRWSVTEAGDQRIVDVVFDRSATGGRILLAGRYLYLAAPAEVDLSGDPGPVVLEPEVGAWIVGTVRTQGASATPDDSGTFGTVTLRGAAMGGGRGGRGRGMGFAERRFELLDESLEFEFRGVQPNLVARLSADVPAMAPGESDRIELAAGTKVVTDISLAPGGAIEGRVVDPQGQGVAGATVAANRGGAMWGRPGGPARETTTGDDGTFRVIGLGAGDYRLEASLEGWRNARSEDEFEVETASTRTGALIEIDPGFVITGKVVLPGGAPAGGAELRLEQAGAPQPGRQASPWGRGGDQKERQRTTAGDDGSFTFLALTESPARIAAAFEVGSDGEQTRTFAAITEDVSPRRRADAEPIEITLARTLSVRGRVVDDAGAPVTAFEVRAAREGYSSRSGAGDGVREPVESEDGTFEVGGLGEGTWRVSVSADGHSSPDDQTQTFLLPQDDAPLTFTLPRLAAIRGTVVDPSGVAIAGARVSRIPEQGGFGGFGGRGRAAGAETDENGAFELRNLTPGSQTIEARSENWAPSPALVVQAAAGEGGAPVVLELRRGGTIRGVVRDEGGAPWADRRVSYSQGSGPMAMFGGESTTTTDAAGQFLFEHVAEGSWTVNASPSEAEMMETMRGARDQGAFFELMGKNLTAEVVVADGEEVFVELGAEPAQPVVIFGAVTRAASPVTSGAVTFAREGGDLFSNLVRATIEGDGTYRLELKRPGAYVVSLERGRRRNQFFVDVAPPAEEGATQRMDLAVPEGGIAGRVRTPGGDPTVGQRVSAEARSSLALSRFDPPAATTDDEGYYELLDLDPGTYTLRVGQRGFGFGGGSGSTYGRALVDGVVVNAESITAGVDIRLSGSGRVVGEVVDAEGAPVSGASIFIRDASGRSIDSISSVRTEPSGRFTYDRIAPGNYVVSARTADGAAPDEAGVVVSEGEDTAVSLRLEPATTLVVTTTDEEDNAVRAELSVVDSDGREMTGLVGTELFRSFGEGISTSEQRVGPLPPGRYTVTATAPDGRTEKKRVTIRTRDETRVRIRFEASSGD